MVPLKIFGGGTEVLLSPQYSRRDNNNDRPIVLTTHNRQTRIPDRYMAAVWWERYGYSVGILWSLQQFAACFYRPTVASGCQRRWYSGKETERRVG